MADLEFPDLMVDTETTGVNPDRNAMIQLSAVKFNLRERTVGPTFDACLLIPPNRAWSESTREWWSKMPETLQAIFNRMRRPQDVMPEFRDWVGGTNYVFWAKPSHFDFQFVQSYCADYEVASFLNHSTACDSRSFMRGLGFPGPIIEPALPFAGVEHHALFDAFHQIKVLFAACDQAKMGVVQ